MNKNGIGLVVLTMALVPSDTASGQSVTDVLTFLVTNQGVQTGSVDRDRAAAQATSVTISRALLADLATLPVATSSSGFLYRLNPELGTEERVTPSFGPFFVERALTAGREQMSLGVSFQQLHFTSLDGNNLRNGSLVTTANQFVDERAPFDVDQLTLNIDASVATLYGSLGVTDNLEVGFAAPMVSLILDGSRTNIYRGRTFTQATAHATTFGLADLVLRAKLNVYRREASGLAGAVDVRLPTGRQQNLLGAGSTAVKFSAIGSLERGRLSTHGNGGVSIGGLATEFDYGGALALAATGRLTVVGEVIGRWINMPGSVVPSSAPNPTLQGVETIRLVPGDSKLNIVSVVPGMKWNLSSTWVLAANVRIPLTNAGLTAPVTPFVGLDYELGR